MKIKIVNWYKLKWKELFSINLNNNLAELWYKEVMRRFHILAWLLWEETKQRYLNDFPVFDIDEAFETWTMSGNHFDSMTEFLFNNEK